MGGRYETALISLFLAVAPAGCISSLPDYSVDASSEDATVRGDAGTALDAVTRGPSPDALQKIEDAARDTSTPEDAAREAEAAGAIDAPSGPDAPRDVSSVDVPVPPAIDAGACDAGCGTCETCVAGKCQYAGTCTGITCGPDSCGNGSCGTCPACNTCTSGSCAYAGSCAGRSCGTDSCGNGSCGACPACNTCNGAGACVYAGSCSGLSCGPDSCGNGGDNMCGGCQANYLCSGGQCLGACYARCCSASSCGDGALEGPWPEPTQAACQSDHEATACPNGGVWKMSWANTEDFYVRSSCPSSC